MEEDYFVKISGVGTVVAEVDRIRSMLRKLKRLNMEIEQLRTEKEEKKKVLLERIDALGDSINAFKKAVPRAKLRSKKVLAAVEKPETTKKTKKKRRSKRARKKVTKETPGRPSPVTELSNLRVELEKLKKELEE